MLVADASVTLEWFLPGQLTASAAAAQAIARTSLIVVPVIWILETQNVVLKLLRQRKLSNDEVQQIRIELALMSKRVMPLPGPNQIELIWEIAVTRMMTFYDASYVALAWELGLPLASSDGAVRAAGKALGIPLV